MLDVETHTQLERGWNGEPARCSYTLGTYDHPIHECQCHQVEEAEAALAVGVSVSIISQWLCTTTDMSPI